MKNFGDRPLSSKYRVRTHRGTKTVRFDNLEHVARIEYNMREYFKRQDRGECRTGECVEAN